MPLLSSNPAPAARRGRLREWLTLLGAMVLACASHWAAADIPEQPTRASISADLLFNVLVPERIHIITFGEHQLAGTPGRLVLNSALFPSPFVVAAPIDVRDGFFGRVVATLNYELVVVGPDGDVGVRFLVNGEIRGAVLPPPLGTGGFAMRALWSFANASGDVPPLFDEGGVTTAQNSGNFFDDFADEREYTLRANRRYKVTLIADAAIGNSGANGAAGGAFAFVDPLFSFLPEVGPEYSFVFSEGVGNLPVPEPSKAALLLLGLLTLLGLRGRIACRPEPAR